MVSERAFQLQAYLVLPEITYRDIDVRVTSAEATESESDHILVSTHKRPATLNSKAFERCVGAQLRLLIYGFLSEVILPRGSSDESVKLLLNITLVNRRIRSEVFPFVIDALYFHHSRSLQDLPKWVARSPPHLLRLVTRISLNLCSDDLYPIYCEIERSIEDGDKNAALLLKDTCVTNGWLESRKATKEVTKVSEHKTSIQSWARFFLKPIIKTRQNESQAPSSNPVGQRPTTDLPPRGRTDHENACAGKPIRYSIIVLGHAEPPSAFFLSFFFPQPTRAASLPIAKLDSRRNATSIMQLGKSGLNLRMEFRIPRVYKDLDIGKHLPKTLASAPISIDYTIIIDDAGKDLPDPSIYIGVNDSIGSMRQPESSKEFMVLRECNSCLRDNALPKFTTSLPVLLTSWNHVTSGKKFANAIYYFLPEMIPITKTILQSDYPSSAKTRVTPLLAQASSLDLDRVKLYWTIKAADIGLALDSFERLPGLGLPTMFKSQPVYSERSVLLKARLSTSTGIECKISNVKIKRYDSAFPTYNIDGRTSPFTLNPIVTQRWVSLPPDSADGHASSAGGSVSTRRIIAMVGELTTSGAADVIAQANTSTSGSAFENESNNTKSSPGTSTDTSAEKSISSEGIPTGGSIATAVERVKNVIGTEAFGVVGSIEDATATARVEDFLEPAGTRISVEEARGLENLLRKALRYLPD
ncbi:hypothetical protein B7494_g4029 [Chlorociboria aeruginascens]|nr:hypothetical protein B7494_g4029 [Chlorociboria aeruginascens]